MLLNRTRSLLAETAYIDGDRIYPLPALIAAGLCDVHRAEDLLHRFISVGLRRQRFGKVEDWLESLTHVHRGRSTASSSPDIKVGIFSLA